MRVSEPVPFLPEDASYTSTGVVKAPVPDGDDLALSGVFLPTAAVDPAGAQVSLFPDARIPRLVLTAWTGDIGLGDGSPQSVYELDTSAMEQVRGEDGEPLVLVLEPGQTVELPDGLGSVTFADLPRFAAFQVRDDPSGPLALVAAVLAMVGLTVSLFLPRRRVWVRLAPAPAGPSGAGGAVPGADPGPGRARARAYGGAGRGPVTQPGRRPGGRGRARARRGPRAPRTAPRTAPRAPRATGTTTRPSEDR